MRSTISDGRIQNALSLITGHQKWVEKNTGLTIDSRKDLYIQNPDGILSNNRHFIADTMMEYQPNGDGTTEGQAVHILGYIHAYLATEDKSYLNAAVWHWEAYVEHFYAGQPIPDEPQRWICNWIINSKEPSIANYPINSVDPTLGGYKCVPLQFINGKAQIPHGPPFWGEYLDVCTYAHRGHMTWEAINASVQKIEENVAGDIDWQDIYDNYLLTEVDEPHKSTAWINWPKYLGVPSYTVRWGGSNATEKEYPINWMVAWTGNKIGVGPGPDDQLWSGDIIEEGLPHSEKGTIQLQDTSINGVWLFNYAVRLPVTLGGYEFKRNEVWHNRPINTPLLGSANQMGNAADGEVWFIDACYMLWRITGEDKYKKALESVFCTAHEYTDIDSADAFFRRSRKANTPFTDGISYSFSYPEQTDVTYGRTGSGDISITTDRDAQHFLEQQSIWYRVNKDSILHVNQGGAGVYGGDLKAKVLLDIHAEKADGLPANWWEAPLPNSTLALTSEYNIPLKHFAKVLNDRTGEEYIVADSRAVTDYGGCEWMEIYQAEVWDGRPAKVVEAFFPNDDAGFIIGSWLQDKGTFPLQSIVYSSDADFNVRAEDVNGWRWYWLLPATYQEWRRFTFHPQDAILSGYQPGKDGMDPPPSLVLDEVDQVSVLLEHSEDVSKTFSYYCINDIPPLFNKPDGWTLTFRIVFSADEPYTAVLGDSLIKNYRPDSLAYCPGVIPFSNIYAEGTEQIGAWHGMPYPGYQYPMMYCIHDDDSYDLQLKNQIDFLYDSQEAYYKQVGVMGPGCAAYIWDRWDNYKYGPKDTWTTFHWGDGKPWAGYQPRAYAAAARAWYELVTRDKPVPANLKTYVERWVSWLVQFIRDFNGHTPNEFPTAPYIPEWVPNDFTGHMCGLWLTGSSYAALAGCDIDGLDELIESCVSELVDEYDVTPISEHPMNGCWSPALRLESGNGMAFGFYTGEIFRALGLYILYRKHGPKYNIFSPAVINKAKDASLSVIMANDL